MKTLTRESFERLVRDERIEAVTDLNRFGRLEIRWLRTGRRETVSMTSAPNPGRLFRRSYVVTVEASVAPGAPAPFGCGTASHEAAQLQAAVESVVSDAVARFYQTTFATVRVAILTSPVL
jgi:hypothetical protein